MKFATASTPFDGSPFIKLYLGRNISYDRSSPFSNKTTLNYLTISNNVTSIGGSTFYGCSGLTSIVVAEDNATYDSRDSCNAIIETSSNTLITGCKNTIIPSSVTSIGDYAFYRCSGLTSISIPNSVTTIGTLAFRGCSGLTSISIPNSVTAIGNSAFEGCSGLTSMSFPDSITHIDDYACYGCIRLSSVSIGNRVSSIGNYAFFGCTSIDSITSLNKMPPTIGNYTFSEDTYKKALLSVPLGSKTAYSQANYWKNFFHIEELSETPTGINATVSSGSTNGKAIYTLDGKRVSNANVSKLPKGIYIVDGKKMIIR